jgi:hypothetical protein
MMSHAVNAIAPRIVSSLSLEKVQFFFIVNTGVGILS